MANFKDLVRIGKDAHIRYTQGGKAVTSFSAAFDTGWGDNKQTVWLDCSLWGDRGEKVAHMLTKGTQVMIEGDIGTREYEGKTYITLKVSEFKFAGGGRSEGERRPQQRQERQSAPAGNDFEDDSIPF